MSSLVGRRSAGGRTGAEECCSCCLEQFQKKLRAAQGYALIVLSLWGTHWDPWYKQPIVVVFRTVSNIIVFAI